MGQSTNAILVFGFEIDGEGEKPEFLGEHEDLEEYIVVKAGKKDASYDEWRELEKACPADLVRHCSCDYPMYILAVRGSKTTAFRGYPEKITIESMVIEPEKVAALKEWCEANNVEYKEPGWLLCSMWS